MPNDWLCTFALNSIGFVLDLLLLFVASSWLGVADPQAVGKITSTSVHWWPPIIPRLEHFLSIAMESHPYSTRRTQKSLFYCTPNPAFQAADDQVSYMWQCIAPLPPPTISSL